MKEICRDQPINLALFDKKILHSAIIKQHCRVNLEDIKILFGYALETAEHIKYDHDDA